MSSEIIKQLEFIFKRRPRYSKVELTLDITRDGSAECCFRAGLTSHKVLKLFKRRRPVENLSIFVWAQIGGHQ